uniref:Uncharacterized protein n=1 Tax=Oryzias latipes TaxID=8090 RepID=A0A3P9HKX4_ORYLA
MWPTVLILFAEPNRGYPVGCVPVHFPQKEYKHQQQLLSCCLADGSFHDSSSAAIVSHRANFKSNQNVLSSIALPTISLAYNVFKNWFCFPTTKFAGFFSLFLPIAEFAYNPFHRQSDSLF